MDELPGTQPLVSVIMPTYDDDVDRLLESVRSVLDQSCDDFELLIIDDCSTTTPIPRVLALHDSRIVAKRLCPNQGAASARNYATQLARGRYIAFIDSDDIWYPSKLERQLDFAKRTGAAFVYTLYDLIDNHGRVFGDSGSLPTRSTYSQLLKHCFIRTSSVLYDTHGVRGKVYFPDIRRRQDFGLFLKLLKAAGEGLLLEEKTCAYRIRHDSLAADKLGNIRFQWKVYHEVEDLPFAHSLVLMVQWFVRAGIVGIRRKVARATVHFKERLVSVARSPR